MSDSLITFHWLRYISANQLIQSAFTPHKRSGVNCWDCIEWLPSLSFRYIASLSLLSASFSHSAFMLRQPGCLRGISRLLRFVIFFRVNFYSIIIKIDLTKIDWRSIKYCYNTVKLNSIHEIKWNLFSISFFLWFLNLFDKSNKYKEIIEKKRIL